MANKVEVEIAARATGFAAEFSKISAAATAAGSRIRTALSGVSSAGAALGVSLSGAGFALFIKGAIDSADRLNDLSKATGVAATTLGGIGFAAEQAGTDIDGVAKSFGKLNLLIADALSGNEKALDTFTKLGISIAELRTSKPEEIFAKTATTFSEFEEGANKVAGANAVFGKSFASMLPFLDEGGEALRKNIAYYQRYAGVTDELVQASDEFNDSLTKLGLLNRAFANHLASALLPSLQQLADYFVSAKEEGDRFKGTADDIAGVIRAIAVAAVWGTTQFVAYGRAFGAIAAQAAALLRLDFAGVSAIQDGIEAEQKERFARMEGLLAAINSSAERVGPPSSKAAGGGGRGRRPAPNFGAGASATTAGGKAAADEFARALGRVAKMAAEADLELAAMFSTEEMTGAQKALAGLVASDEWQKFTAGQQADLTARYQAIAAVERETAAWKSKREEQEKSIEALRRVAEEQQNAVAAFTADLGQYAEENSYLERSIALVGQDEVARQKLAEAINYESLRKKALLADDQAGLAILDQQYARRIELIDQLAAANKRLAEVQQYNAIVAEEFSNSLQDVINGTKSLKDAVLDFGNGVATRITGIVADKLAQSVFGGSGGFGEFMADLFGTGGAAAGGAAGGAAALTGAGATLTGAGATLTASGTLLTASGTVLTTAGAALTAAAAALTAGSATDAASSIAGAFVGPAFGEFASGTNFAPGGWARVGERGEEMVYLPRGAQVIPNHVLQQRRAERSGGAPVYSSTINVPPGANTQSIRQAAKAGWRAASGTARRG